MEAGCTLWTIRLVRMLWNEGNYTITLVTGLVIHQGITSHVMLSSYKPIFWLRCYGHKHLANLAWLRINRRLSGNRSSSPVTTVSAVGPTSTANGNNACYTHYIHSAYTTI